MRCLPLCQSIPGCCCSRHKKDCYTLYHANSLAAPAAAAPAAPAATAAPHEQESIAAAVARVAADFRAAMGGGWGQLPAAAAGAPPSVPAALGTRGGAGAGAAQQLAQVEASLAAFSFTWHT